MEIASSHRQVRVERLAAGHPQLKLPVEYLAFFHCFNEGRYFEAHEVLESLWLQDREGPSGDFYKGLIQIAGAFVHFEKGRPQPGSALLKRACFHLGKYPPCHQHWHVAEGMALISQWISQAPLPGCKPILPEPSPTMPR